MEQDACKGQSLFLPARQDLVPGRLLLKTTDQVAEPDKPERFRHLLEVLALRGLRVGSGLSQGANGNVGPLWHQKHFRAAGDLNLALAPGPKASNRSHQRAFSGAGFSRNQDTLALRNIDLCILDDGFAAVERH